jgi:hypothetical protein
MGKRTGERVAIEEISPRDLPLIYASDLAEQRIKHEVREADDNVYKKGFIVDVNVQLVGGAHGVDAERTLPRLGSFLVRALQHRKQYRRQTLSAAPEYRQVIDRAGDGIAINHDQIGVVPRFQ